MEGEVSQNPAESYEEFFVPALFGPWAEQVADSVGIPSTAAVLDVACGTGVLARTIAPRLGPSGSVTGLDISDEMLSVARRIAPQIEWHQGDATALPFEDSSFDRVVCQFGLMLLTDRHAGLAEMVRVLRPGGRLGVAVWDSVERCGGYARLTALLDHLFGTEVGDKLRAPFCMGDIAALLEHIHGLQVTDIEIEIKEGPARFPSLRDWMSADVWGWLAMEHDFTATDFDKLMDAASDELGKFVQEDGSVQFEMNALIVSATAAG